MKRVVFLLSVLLSTFDVHSQNPYVDATTVTADGITFEVDFSTYVFYLSNIANSRSEIPLYYKDGRKLKTEAEYRVLHANYANRNDVYRAFKGVLSDDVIKAFREERRSPIKVCYTISSEGETLEVAFIMQTHPLILSLPPETFATLEKRLKQYVKWEPNEYAKVVSYFHMSGMIDFKKIPLSSAPDSIEKPDSVSDKKDREWNLPVLEK